LLHWFRIMSGTAIIVLIVAGLIALFVGSLVAGVTVLLPGATLIAAVIIGSMAGGWVGGIAGFFVWMAFFFGGAIVIGLSDDE